MVSEDMAERADDWLLSMVNGDADHGMGSLASVGGTATAASYDASIVAAGNLTQKAFMLWIAAHSKRAPITHIVTDINGALAIQNRSGRPVITGDNGTSTRINTNESVMNPTWGDNVQVFITDDASWPAKTIMGIDARFAIQRVTSTNASYQAQEDFVLRRASAMRFDYGSVSRRLYNDAFEVLTFA